MANCNCLMSPCVIPIFLFFPDSISQTNTNSAEPLLFLISLLRIRSGNCSSSRLRIFPLLSMTSESIIFAAASIKPEPQIPIAGTSPMTAQSKSCAASTFSMAPSAPLIPSLICAPSRAGPAGAEQAVSRSREPITTSPFVPISTKTRISSLSCIRVDRMQPTVSAPTKPAIIGSKHTCALGAAFSGSSRAGRITLSRMTGA